MEFGARCDRSRGMALMPPLHMSNNRHLSTDVQETSNSGYIALELVNVTFSYRRIQSRVSCSSASTTLLPELINNRSISRPVKSRSGLSLSED